jgi:DMSO reductase family type II enzyme heme b subunit
MSRIGALVLLAAVGLGGTAAHAAGDPERGKALARAWCAGCHGAEGKGNGPAAARLDPRPRDFTTGTYKIRSTPSGGLPTDADLFRTITVGMPGSAMPGWDHLSGQEREDLVAYLKVLSPRFGREPAPAPLPIGAPPPGTDAARERGRTLYADLGCPECHGEAGRGDGPSAPTLKDEAGFPIRPANLTKPWTFRGGSRPEDLARTIRTGLAGTPMPAYAESMDEAQTWDLVAYLRTLAPARPPEVRGVLRARAVPGEAPRTLEDPAWEVAEGATFPLAGQLLIEPRLFAPATDSVTVRALYGGDALALLLEWDDPSRSAGEGGRPPDAASVQFPVRLSEGLERPAFSMGGREAPVSLWLWRAGGAAPRELAAAGPEKPRVQSAAGQGLTAAARFEHGRWRVLLRRALVTAEGADDLQFIPGTFIPIAFAVWEGGRGEAGARKAVSSWYTLVLEPPLPARVFLWPPLAAGMAVVLEVLLLRRARRQAANARRRPAV